MTLRSRLSCVLAAGVGALSCTSTVTELKLDDHRFELWDLAVPRTVITAEPFTIQIRYGMGACDEVTAISGRMAEPTRVELEVRGRFIPGLGNRACPDIQLLRDTVFTMIAPDTGELAIIGLQPGDQDPIERSITVSPRLP